MPRPKNAKNKFKHDTSIIHINKSTLEIIENQRSELDKKNKYYVKNFIDNAVKFFIDYKVK